MREAIRLSAVPEPGATVLQLGLLGFTAFTPTYELTIALGGMHLDRHASHAKALGSRLNFMAIFEIVSGLTQKGF
jgi:hypothetical protein